MATPYVPQTYTYKIVAACPIQADVYLPYGQGPHPAILWLHGGALIFGSRAGLRPDQLVRYLDAGYAVVAADYRLAPETKLPEIIADLRDAWAWLHSEGRLLSLDPARLAVAGHSAGGYLTLMSGFCLTPRPRALISFYGYGDIIADWYTRPDPYYCSQPVVPIEEARQAVGREPLSSGPADPRFRFYLHCRQHGLWPQEVAGHDPAVETDWYGAYCPLRNVTADYPPTLLAHGDQDTDVPFEQSAQMAEALQREGVLHEFIALPGRGHGFDGAAQGLGDPVVAGVFDRVIAFLNQYNS